jgi:hypothetical protein
MSQLVKTKRQANFKDFCDLKPLRGSSNKKTLYSTRSCVNWAFFWHSLNKLLFYNNDEKTDMLLIYGECGKNSVAAADVYKPMVDTSNTFYINLIR